MSNVDAALLEQLLLTADRTGLPRPEWIQNGLSLLNRADEKDLLPLLTSEGIGYTPFSALAGGVLSDRYLDGAGVEPGSRIAVAGSTTAACTPRATWPGWQRSATSPATAA